jgi:hypothetical protein
LRIHDRVGSDVPAKLARMLGNATLTIVTSRNATNAASEVTTSTRRACGSTVRARTCVAAS